MTSAYIYCWMLTSCCCGNYNRSKGGSQLTKSMCLFEPKVWPSPSPDQVVLLPESNHAASYFQSCCWRRYKLVSIRLQALHLLKSNMLKMGGVSTVNSLCSRSFLDVSFLCLDLNSIFNVGGAGCFHSLPVFMLRYDVTDIYVCR